MRQNKLRAVLPAAALLAAFSAAGAQETLDRGTGAFLTGRIDSAIFFFSGAIKDNTKDSRAREILGYCQVIKAKDAMRDGRYTEAREALAEAGKLLPQNPDIKTLGLLAELEENAPTPAVPISTAALETTAEAHAVFECLFGDGPCAKGGRYALHVVREGETMSEIAIKYYNDTTLWERIWGANPHLPNPHRLEKGVKLLIPLDAAPPAPQP